MNITLKPDIEKRINETLRKGEFESAEAIVEEALTLFFDVDEEMSSEEFLDTKAAVNEALDQADRGEGISLEEFDQNMRKKHGISR